MAYLFLSFNDRLNNGSNFKSELYNQSLTEQFEYIQKRIPLDRQVGINKMGLGTSHTSNGITTYNQYYIRTIPTVVAVLAAVCAPQLLPAVGIALGYI